MKKTIYPLFYIIILFTISCNDFLEPKSNSEYVPKDVTSLNEILLGESYMHPNDQTKLHLFIDILDDDIQTSAYSDKKQNANRYPALKAAFSWDKQMFYKFSDTGITENICNIWKNIYRKILGTNAIMDYINDASGTEEQKKIVKAQALTLRAYYHFYLVNIFATPYNIDKVALGIPLRLSSKIQDTPIGRNTVEEVFSQVLADLHEAEQLYLLIPQAQQFKRDFRTSLPLVNLLLSRVYLYMENWTKASLYAKKVINDKNFKLLNLNDAPEKSHIFTSENNPEAIWLYGNPGDIFDFASERWRLNYSFITIFVASPDLVSLYEDEDLRKSKYLVKQYQTSFYTAYSKIALLSSGYISFNNQFGRSIRLSEAYLNYSEANIMLAKKDEKFKEKAIKALNTLREKRYVKKSNFIISEQSIDKLIKIVRDERRRELCFEGQRWFDLKRYGMPKIKHIWSESETEKTEFVLHEKDPRYILPIPYWALEVNKSLTQNP